ncbi:hypothetical protein VTN02DRAFT_5178 [Thermoascus thermophilus]
MDRQWLDFLCESLPGVAGGESLDESERTKSRRTVHPVIILLSSSCPARCYAGFRSPDFLVTVWPVLQSIVCPSLDTVLQGRWWSLASAAQCPVAKIVLQMADRKPMQDSLALGFRAQFQCLVESCHCVGLGVLPLRLEHGRLRGTRSRDGLQKSLTMSGIAGGLKREKGYKKTWM